MFSFALADCLLLILALDHRTSLSCGDLEAWMHRIATNYPEETTRLGGHTGRSISSCLNDLRARGLVECDGAERYQLTRAGLLAAQAPCGQAAPALLDLLTLEPPAPSVAALAS
jgi:hypothetical protein